MTCDEARLLVPEAALDLLDAAVRAEVLEHVAGCVPCRAELDALAGTADLLLSAVPPAEPPPGFEGRVLARLAQEPTRAVRVPARRWLAPVAAAVAAVGGIAVGLGIGGGGDSRGGVVAATLLGAKGEAVGQVLVSDDPDRMVCVLDGSPAGARYEVAVRGGDGESRVGTFTAEGPGQPWATDLPIDGAEVRRVVIRDSDGTLRASADLLD